MKTHKYTAIVEIRISDEKLNELSNWEVEPTTYLESVIGDHLAERGLINSVRTWDLGNISKSDDVVVSAYTTLNNVAESLQKSVMLEQLEQDILTASCPSGVCDD